ncbi:MAG: diguanylate cyclase [Phycisphaerae bacterium]|nr:diguanylate cyclase [Phycisphaerae bacterium]
MNVEDQPKIPRILIIEHDGDQRMLMCEALSLHYGDGSGQDIVGVASGADALAQKLTSFDVVLQAYDLPDVDGLKLLEQILARADLPVIFVTGEKIATTAAKAIKHGAQDYVVRLGDYLFALPVVIDKSIRQHEIKKENDRLQQELKTMLSELRVKNVQLEESLDKLKTMATTDHLTGLANRRRFGEILQRYFSQAKRYGFDLTCCMGDLDNYKHLNDTFGHQIGDDILVLAADVIRESLRGSDVAARYGGDEFVILVPHTPVERALAVGERIRGQLVARSSNYRNLVNPVTISMGIASLRSDNPPSADALVAMADRALYTAKGIGRDCIVRFVETADAITPSSAG